MVASASMVDEAHDQPKSSREMAPMDKGYAGSKPRTPVMPNHLKDEARRLEQIEMTIRNFPQA